MRVMGIDLGQVRIGIALSDQSGILATPHGVVVRAKSEEEDIAKILELVSEHNVTKIVVGLPNSLSEKNVIAREHALSFIDALAKAAKHIEIATHDERFTSVMASNRLRELGHDSRSMKGKIDASAAALILQEFLDVNRA